MKKYIQNIGVGVALLVIPVGIYASISLHILHRPTSRQPYTLTDTVVVLKNKISEDETATCAAVVIGARRGYSLALTAAHCFPDAEQAGTDGDAKAPKRDLSVITHQGVTAPAYLIWKSGQDPVDLALIKIAHGGLAHAAISCQNPAPGQHVFTIGHPLGATWSRVDGTVERITGTRIQLNMGVLPGNSGGPLFDDSGHVIGIVTAVRLFAAVFMPAVTTMGFAQSATTVCSALAR